MSGSTRWDCGIDDGLLLRMDWLSDVTFDESPSRGKPDVFRVDWRQCILRKHHTVSPSTVQQNGTLVLDSDASTAILM